MRREAIVFLLIFFAFWMINIHLLMPKSNATAQYFPFHTAEMVFRGYIYLAGWHLVPVILIAGITTLIHTQFRHIMDWYFGLFVGYLADYLLIYHGPFGKIGGVNIAYTHFMAAGMFVLTAIAIRKSWKLRKL